MIACKEDLINTYIKNDNSTIKSLYLGLCEKFNIKACNSFEGDCDLICVYSCNNGQSDPWEIIDMDVGEDKKDATELTLADLKPKRTNVEYVKCEHGGKASNAVMDFENGEPLCKMIGNEYWPIDELDDLFSIILDGAHIYRRIETEIDERQEFIDACMKSASLRTRDGAHEVYGELYDSGKFKLVDGE